MIRRNRSNGNRRAVGRQIQVALLLAAIASAGVVISRGALAQNAGNSGDTLDPMHVAAPPVTRTDNVVDTYFGTKVTDPFRWLEDQNSPETRAWIARENAYTDSILKKLPGRDVVSARLAQMLKVDSTGLPIERGGRYFFSKRRADEDQEKIYFRQGRAAQDQLLVDPLPMSPAHNMTVNLAMVSSDGTIITYLVRQGGADETVPHILNVDTKTELPDQFPKGLYFGGDFTPDKSGIYYAKQSGNGPRVYYHKMGTAASEDKIIFGEGYGPEKIIIANLASDDAHLLIHVLYGSSADRSEVYMKDIVHDGPIVPILTDVNARFQADIGGGKIYIQTNWNAPMEKVMVADVANPGKEHWSELVPESDAHIEGTNLAGGKICVLYSRNASSQMRIFSSDAKLVREVTMPTVGTASTLFGRWGSGEAFYEFTSFFTPGTIYRYEVNTGAQSVWSKSEVPVNSDQFTAEQVWFSSKDGTRVPMFVAHKKGLKMDGSAPALLTGYGGFNVSETPSFSSSAVVWMEQGGVYAVATLRGGGEFGEKWHQAGMMEKKQNVFDDFIGAAEYLVAQHYTSTPRLTIRGGSNGGLLVGAALTQRPDLFAAVVCSFPLLDMLRYQNFLVAKFWVPEYGSSEKEDQFKYIYVYSPYQHVKAGTKYPGVLFVSGDSDTRVAPLHARKMAALMQASAAPGRPILLKYDTQAGHSGGTPVTRQVEDATDALIFLFWQTGVTPK
ncbi:MAG TPA: prolyl oligopeptidase family serine peptidase [Candidatus Acidoferrales bacterium]|jgi:prolyl oligopeptidase|nr:prolyl oligopeptidase family serine peptidase [Candidatus Acidoferrales bacterium]